MQSQLFKVTNKGKLPRMFSLTYSFPATRIHWNFVEKSTWKQSGLLDNKITSKKVIRNTVDISTKEITSKKVGGNDVDFSTIEITSKKVRGNDVNFSISESTSKKYVETTWKFVEVWSSTYRRNIHVESTSIRRGVPVGLLISVYY